MGKTKFTWTFSLDEKKESLEVCLNDGMNEIIHLKHPLACFYIGNKLAEVMRWRYAVGNKTEIFPEDTDTVYEALGIAKSYLEKYENWTSLIDEANENHKKGDK